MVLWLVCTEGACSGQKNVGGYLAIKLYENIPVNLLVLFCIHIEKSLEKISHCVT